MLDDFLTQRMLDNCFTITASFDRNGTFVLQRLPRSNH